MARDNRKLTINICEIDANKAHSVNEAYLQKVLLLNSPCICPNRKTSSASIGGLLRSSKRVVVTVAGPMIATALAVCLASCSASKHLNSNDEGAKLSPRVVRVGDPIPKGGGVRKLGDPYLANGRWYTPVNDETYDKVGQASWYGDFFHGRQTANGEVYDMNALTAAHPTFAMPTYAKVTNLANNRSIVVRVNDRGPYASDRIIDVSHRAAELLGFHKHGMATVRVQYYGPAPISGDDSVERSVLAKQPWATHVERTPENDKVASNLVASAVSRTPLGGGGWVTKTQGSAPDVAAAYSPAAPVQAKAAAFSFGFN